MVNSTNEGEDGRTLEQRSKAVFDESANSLDARTRSALTQARHAAMTEIERRRPLMWRIWGPVSGAAAAAFVLIVMFAPLRLQPTAVEQSTSPFEDLEIVVGTDNLEMLEDLDFYAWIESVEPLVNDG